MRHLNYTPTVNKMLDDDFNAWMKADNAADYAGYNDAALNEREAELAQRYEALKREAMAGNRIAANARITIKAMPPTDKRPYSRRILDVDALDNEPHVFGWVR